MPVHTQGCKLNRSLLSRSAFVAEELRGLVRLFNFDFSQTGSTSHDLLQSVHCLRFAHLHIATCNKDSILQLHLNECNEFCPVSNNVVRCWLESIHVYANNAHVSRISFAGSFGQIASSWNATMKSSSPACKRDFCNFPVYLSVPFSLFK